MSMNTIQQNIAKLSFDTIDSLVQEIKDMNLITNDACLYELLHIIFDISDLRPTLTKVLVSFVSKVSESYKQFNDIIQFHFYRDIINGPSGFCRTPRHYFIYSELLKQRKIDEMVILQKFQKRFKLNQVSFNAILAFPSLFSQLLPRYGNDFNRYHKFINTTGDLYIFETKGSISMKRDELAFQLYEQIVNDDLEGIISNTSDPMFDFDYFLYFLPYFQEFIMLRNDLYKMNENNCFVGISLIDCCCFFGSNKIFKYLLMNQSKLSDASTNLAVMGGNFEIIRILDQQGLIFNERSLQIAVKSYQNEIARWIFDNHFTSKLAASFVTNNLLVLDFYINKFDASELINQECISLIRLIKFHSSPRLFKIICENKSRDLFNYYINRSDFDINSQTFLYTYPIFLAIKLGFKESYYYLISKRVNLNVTTVEGFSTHDLKLYYLQSKDNLKKEAHLLNHKIDLVYSGSEYSIILDHNDRNIKDLFDKVGIRFRVETISFNGKPFSCDASIKEIGISRGEKLYIKLIEKSKRKITAKIVSINRLKGK